MTKSFQLDETKRLMVALGRMPPKQHSEMKVGKPRAKADSSPKRGRGRPPKANPTNSAIFVGFAFAKSRKRFANRFFCF
jgi:hypothetical protein